MGAAGRKIAPLEVGIVYSRGPSYFLAVGIGVVMNDDGRIIRVDEQSRLRYEAERGISVVMLAKAWRISAGKLDALFRQHVVSPEALEIQRARPPKIDPPIKPSNGNPKEGRVWMPTES